MASEITICNLALSRLGERPIQSLSPPDGSANADRCAQFYPAARDALLAMHPWSFALKRAPLAEMTNDATEWRFCYAVPSDCLKIVAVMPASATSDYDSAYPFAAPPYPYGSPYLPSRTFYQPSDYVREARDDGTAVIRTNAEGAMLRYVAYVTDVDRWTPLFNDALSVYLASNLAGPILKGDAGAKQGLAMLDIFLKVALPLAKDADALQRQVRPQQSVSAINAR